MSVVLYRPGTTHKAKGIDCEIQICDEYSYLHNLDNGWFYTPEECYAEINNTPSENSLNSDIVDYENMPIGELREMAREIDPTIDRRAHRTRLIRILSNDNQG